MIDLLVGITRRKGIPFLAMIIRPIPVRDRFPKKEE